MANTYEGLIEEFLYQQSPFATTPQVRFEAISTAVFGSKQRRFGPMPPVEVQASVREILRKSGDHIQFFLPWGSRKQHEGEGLDVMEFMAIKQLACLQVDLQRIGVNSSFQFRIEDITDYWLFDFPYSPQVDQYASDLRKLIQGMLEGSNPILETDLVQYHQFHEEAKVNQSLFLDYLHGNDKDAFAKLTERGWRGEITPAQREYYFRQYTQYWPSYDRLQLNNELAKYFASSLARVQLNARALPQGEFVFITFGHPVPDNPNAPNRIFYRTIPERFTNNHRSPWLAKGYLAINERNQVVPKSAGYNEKLNFIEHSVNVNGVQVQADYVLV
jgi:hypothetical protein